MIAVHNAIGDPPEAALISAIAPLDLDELEAGLAVKREHLGVESLSPRSPTSPASYRAGLLWQPP